MEEFSRKGKKANKSSKKPRKRRVGSVTDELVYKSREAALAAVQTFNNPAITFKSEIFIVVICIAWTYLLHAYFRKEKIEYRYYRKSKNGNRKIYDKTKSGAYKYWELERCLNNDESPVEKNAANNLRFLIGLRHEIEHQMTTRIDDYLSARFQACCLNYNDCIKKLFGENKGIDKYLSFSLQFSSINREQKEQLSLIEDLPPHISSFVAGFDGSLSEAEFNSIEYAYRVLFVAKTANRKGQADEVIEFIKPESPLAEDINKKYTIVKETERQKYLPGQIVKIIKNKGYSKFSLHYHTQLWKSSDAKKIGKGYGVKVATTWYWYESWIQKVEAHCKSNISKYQ